MLVAMTKVQIVGRKHQVEPILGRLYGMGLLELGSALDEPALELAPYPGEDERAERGQRAAPPARSARRPAHARRRLGRDRSRRRGCVAGRPQRAS